MSWMGKITWASGILTLVISIVLALLTSQIFQATGQGILDTEIFGHSARSVNETLSAYQGTDALVTYKKIQHLDLFYLLTYGLFGGCLLYQIFRPSVWKYLGILPIMSAGFDFLENNILAKLVLAYPELDPDLITKVNIFTQTKYALIIVSLAILAVGLLRYDKLKR